MGEVEESGLLAQHHFFRLALHSEESRNADRRQAEKAVRNGDVWRCYAAPTAHSLAPSAPLIPTTRAQRHASEETWPIAAQRPHTARRGPSPGGHCVKDEDSDSDGSANDCESTRRDYCRRSRIFHLVLLRPHVTPRQEHSARVSERPAHTAREPFRKHTNKRSCKCNVRCRPKMPRRVSTAAYLQGEGAGTAGFGVPIASA